MAQDEEHKVVSLPTQDDTTGSDNHPIVEHFFNFFEPYVAVSDASKAAVMQLRHEVYCKELGYLKQDAPTTDAFDNYSYACYIKHFPTDALAGTVRIVHPTANQVLPMEHHCADILTKMDKVPGDFDRTQVCELSRIAIPETFRRRKEDQHLGSAIGVINEATYSEYELRCYPLIVISLYMSAFALARIHGIQHAFALLDPRLARSLRFIGIESQQIGPTIHLHGLRAPHYFTPASAHGLSEAHFALLAAIDNALTKNR